MKKLNLLIVIMLMLVACSSDNEEDNKNDYRDNAINNANENIDFILATDSFTDIWHIEDYVLKGEDLDSDRLFRFTNTNVMDEDKFNSFNGYEKGLVMKTSVMITKSIKGKYDEDKDLFKKDLEEYYDISKNGDDLFLD